MARKTFQLDKENGKLFGVCAGVANYTGWDVTLVRVGLAVATFATGWAGFIIAYCVVAFVARPTRARRRRPEPATIADGLGRRSSAYELRESMTDMDRRMAEIDSYVAGSNPRLAREIEELR